MASIQRVLVTGGAGFLGSHLCERLVEAGDTGKPTLIANPGSPAGEAFALLTGSVARKVAMLYAEAPPVLGGNIEWVNSPG